MTMEGTTEKDCSPLWNLYQQIASDMKNSTPMWEEFISKATKLHSALKSALVAIAAFLDAFQKIADAATNARGATKEIGTALTRVCLRHRAIETRMKTFISALMDTLITPLSERAEEWRRGACASGALGREHARECKRARAELRRRLTDAQRHARKARRAPPPPDAKRRNEVCMQDIQERKQQLEEMEEKAVKAALIEERSRFCHFVSLLNPVVESEVAMLAEVGHLQEGSEQLIRHTAEPRTLPAASLQVICDVKSCYSGWAESSSAPHSPSASSRLGSRKSSLTSISSLNSQCSDQQLVSGSTLSCSTPISNASSSGTLPAPASESQHCLTQSTIRLSSVCSADSGFRSQDALQRRSLYVDNGSDNQSVSSECINQAKSNIEDEHADDGCDVISNAASATWPDLKDTAQFERAASAIMGGRPHTISAAYERGHPRPALSVHTFTHSEQQVSPQRDGGIYARPPLPTRCSSLERPSVPGKSGNANTCQHEFKPSKPSSLPPHLTKEMPQALYVNMSELATLAASRAQQQNAEHPPQEKVCSESSASESSLESSSGYGSQGAFAAEDHSHQHQVQHTDATVWSRRGSSSSLGKPPPPVRRSSSISRAQRPPYIQNNAQSAQMGTTDADNLPPPPAFLLQPDNETSSGDYDDSHITVAETVKQLTELKHMPASPGIVRRSLQQLQNQNNANPQSPTQPSLSTFQQAKSNFSSSTSLNSTGNLNPIYGQTGHRIMAYVENNMYMRKNSLNSSNSDLMRDSSAIYGESRGSPHGSSPSTPSYGENNSFSSFGPRMSNESHYGQTGFKLQQEKKYGQNTIYAQPSEIIAGFNSMSRHDALSPLALRKNIAARSHSADRHHVEHGGLIASLSAKLAPQLSPRTSRRAISTITHVDQVPKGKGSLPAAVQPAFLDKLSATIQQQRRQLDSTRAKSVREMINAHAQPDPRVCHTSLMEQIKRGATLRRNKQCNDRSAPKIR